MCDIFPNISFKESGVPSVPSEGLMLYSSFAVASNSLRRPSRATYSPQELGNEFYKSPWPIRVRLNWPHCLAGEARRYIPQAQQTGLVDQPVSKTVRTYVRINGFLADLGRFDGSISKYVYQTSDWFCSTDRSI